MSNEVDESTHIGRFSKAITVWKRRCNMARDKEERKYVVSLERLVENGNETIKWFNKHFTSQSSLLWLQQFCKIQINPQQSRGGKRELLLSKDSQFRVLSVKDFLKGRYHGRVVPPGAGDPNGEPSGSALPSLSSMHAAAAVPPATDAIAAFTAPLVAPHGEATPTAHAEVEVEAEVASPLAEADLSEHALSGATLSPRLLSRSSKAKISYTDVSRRQKLRVRKALTKELCRIIKESVATDDEYITCTDVLQDVAQSIDRRSRKRKRSEQKRSLAATPLVQKLAAEYVLKKGSRKERKRILSVFSREFSLKELNSLVFLPQANTQVERI